MGKTLSKEAREELKQSLRDQGAEIRYPNDPPRGESSEPPAPASQPDPPQPTEEGAAVDGQEAPVEAPPAEPPAAEEPVTVKVSLADGSEVEVTEEAAAQAMKLGMRLGDESQLNAFLALDDFVRQNPAAGQAFERMIQNPELAEEFIRQHGRAEPAPNVQEDPRDKRIAELEARLAAQQGGGSSPAEQAKQAITASAKRFPALRAIPEQSLVNAVVGRMANGASLSDAVAAEAAAWSQTSTAQDEAKRKKAETATKLRGAGGTGGGPSPSSLAPQKPFSVKDMRKGNVKRALKEAMARRQT